MIYLLSLFLFLFGGEAKNEEKSDPLSYAEYIDQQYLAYKFDDEGYLHPFNGLDGNRQTLQERKKILLYCYFQLQKSKFSDSYLDILERIEDIIDEFTINPPETWHNLLTWEEFKQEYKRDGVTKLSFIGYGSLSNAKDLQKTLPGKREMVPIIGFGGKRIFKVESPTLNNRGLPPLEFQNEVAKLAIEEGSIDYNLENLFNGVMFDLNEHEVEALEKREPGFKLKKFPIVRIDSIFQNPIQVEYAYALINNEPAKESLRPHLNYLNLVINSFDDGRLDSQDTIRLFTETTYLADGKTNIEDWLESEVRQYYEYDLIVQPIVQKHIKAINKLNQ